MYKIKPQLFAFFLMCAFNAAAQEPSKSSLNPCGTLPITDPWLEHYLSNTLAVVSRSNDTLYVGMQVHLLARDNGTGRFSSDRLLDAFCRLNEDYASSNIVFYFKYDWNYLNNTTWFDHDDITTGIDMMMQNDVSGALNCYFVTNPAGNCGYNIPYAGIAMSHSCSGPNDHTWAHEIGHALSLQHTFIGWEGKLYNYGVPTPDTLTYDYTHFHAQPDPIDPAPLDTALVEYADFSNCAQAADKFCDTPPDYLSYRWDCDAQGNSLVKQKDPNGVDFYADGTLFMSYSSDVCANRFSDEQMAAMRANLLAVKTPWLGAPPSTISIDQNAELLSPLNSAEVPALGAVLQWNSVPGATHYIVQASRFPSFALKELDQITTDTNIVCGQLSPDKTYYWRVRPFNAWFTCTNFSSLGSFKTVQVSNITELGDGSLRLYPSLVSAGDALYIEAKAGWVNTDLSCNWYNSNGKLLESQHLNALEGLNRLDAKCLQVPGMYRVVIGNNLRSEVFSIVVGP